MRPLLAMIALGTVLGAAGAGVLVGHAAAIRPVVNDTSLVEQRMDALGQQIADAHHLGALDFSQAHAIDRELFEVRGREHRMKFHDHGALARLDADTLQSQLDQLADELRYSADSGRARTAGAGPDWDPSHA
jgi:hypothetical protein